MRSILFALCLALAPSDLFSQYVLQIETMGNPVTRKLHIGDYVEFRVEGERRFHQAYIEDIWPDEHLILLSSRLVDIDELAALRFVRAWPQAVSGALFAFGGGWSGIAALGSGLDGNPNTSYRGSDAAATVGALALSFAIPIAFKNRTFRADRNHRFRLLDLNIRQAPPPTEFRFR